MFQRTTPKFCTFLINLVRAHVVQQFGRRKFIQKKILHVIQAIYKQQQENQQKPFNPPRVDKMKIRVAYSKLWC